MSVVYRAMLNRLPRPVPPFSDAGGLRLHKLPAPWRSEGVMNRLQASEKRYANLKMLWERERQLNAEMLGALIYLDTAIVPDERKYDEWGYCRIHRDILEDFDRRVKAAIRAAGGKE